MDSCRIKYGALKGCDLYAYGVNRDSDAIRVFSSFGTHPIWISAKLGMERWRKVFYMPTGEIRNSDAIRV